MGRVANRHDVAKVPLLKYMLVEWSECRACPSFIDVTKLNSRRDLIKCVLLREPSFIIFGVSRDVIAVKRKPLQSR